MPQEQTGEVLTWS